MAHFGSSHRSNSAGLGRARTMLFLAPMRFVTFGLAAALVAACSGVGGTGIGDGGASATTDGGTGTDGGNPAGCPSVQPSVGSSCAPNGLACTFSSNPACTGYWDCTGGVWHESFPGAACAVDSGPTGGNCNGTSGVWHRALATACVSNAGVDAGCNIQPHDACLTDTDCGVGYVCLCESPIRAGQVCPGGVPMATGNVCIPANCRVDSDCSACGVCQAQYSCGQITGYYCQTPTDACVPAYSSTSYSGNGCLFQSGHWVSSGTPACPG
jgi:hypothetical protein